MEALLQQLIAPSPPPPISWWPPAPGWWIVAICLLLLTSLLPWLLTRARQRKKHQLQQSMLLFADIPAGLSDSHWLAKINTLLKQRIKQRGDEAATRLFGDAWLDYLCRAHPHAQRDVLQPLAADLYRPQLKLTDAQRQALLKELRRWMRHNNV